MGDLSRKIDVDKLISYSDDLVAVLKDERDMKTLTQCLEQSKSLQSSFFADFNEIQSSIEDYQRKIDACKEKTEKAKSEVAADSDFDLLQKELEEELQKERELMEELRVISNEINDLEHQRVSFEERKQNIKKLEQDELRAQRKLSMYASVTNTIPNLNDDSKISGHIVDRDKRVVEKFEFDPTKMSGFDTCQTIWKVINLQ
ncbi:hypothetical protein HS088_TW03G01129 [Tripterygium wilfordii]|uniref:Uncharacterized protein n=1 Tax=Tripterygium wilfordii TaxID=458696 RepID=A0A7J7DWY0_TRIWF|nr:kinetochore protein SPC24 homolog [Tripterygium wilfordii]XP_038697483.1 kinetochore protein SPC24 homolog [Tripterygium wilfordii]KAF5750789.1 hypothetical protein HS088_TW03G01129 [Tripterygium wilfordii]